LERNVIKGENLERNLVRGEILEMNLVKGEILERNLVRGEILERHLLKVRVHSSKLGSEISGFRKSSEFLNQLSNNKLGLNCQKLTMYCAGLGA